MQSARRAPLPRSVGIITRRTNRCRDSRTSTICGVANIQTDQTPGQRSEVTVKAVATTDDVKRSGVYAVLTPDECVALAKKHGRIVLHPLMGGLEPDFAWEGLELFASEVLPRLRA